VVTLGRMPIAYHRLARTAANRWWRTVLGTLFIVVAGSALAIGLYGIATAAAAIAGRPNDADGFPSLGAHAELALTFLSIAAFLPVIPLAARWIQRRPPGTLSSVEGHLRWPWLVICLGLCTVPVTVLLVVSTLLPGDDGPGPHLVGFGSFLVSAGLLAHVVPLQAVAEEYFTRGWLLQAVGAYCRRPWLPIAVQAVVFAALHGWGTPWGFADLVVFGSVAGWLTVRTGGLEAAIALHVVNNLLDGLVSAAYGDLSVDRTAADLPWQLALVDTGLLIAYAWLVLKVFDRRQVRTGNRSVEARPVDASMKSIGGAMRASTPAE
jgi:membrane protease YdiL (CAAX protease family)